MMLAFRTVHLSKLCLLRVVTEQRQRWRPGNYTVRSSCLSVAFWAFTYLGRKFPWSERASSTPPTICTVTDSAEVRCPWQTLQQTTFSYCLVILFYFYDIYFEEMVLILYLLD